MQSAERTQMMASPVSGAEHQEAESSDQTIERLKRRIAALEEVNALATTTIASLRISEARARLVADSIPAVVGYFDADRRCRYANGTWQAWFGAVPFDASSRGLAAAAELSEAVDQALRGRSRSVEVDVACMDGQTRRLALTARPNMEPGGFVLGVFLVGFDITERARAEAALRDRNELYSLAMKGPNEGLWDWNPNTKELFLSARLLQILGFASDTLRTTSHEWLRLVHPEDKAHYEAAVSRHLKGETEHFECEHRVADRSGNYRWMLARGLAQRGDDGRANRMVGSIGDITEMKRREQAVRDSEARFRSLLQLAGSIILVVGSDGLVQEANREAELALEPPQGAAVGMPWRALMGEDEAGPFAAQLDAALTGSGVRNFEHTLQAKGAGPARVILWSIDRLPGGDGRDPALICVGQDITERKLAEIALRDTNEELERRVAERTRAAMEAKEHAELANRTKSEFLANMSHELRTPLNAIIGFSSMMEAEMLGALGHPKYREYSGVIGSSAQHLLAVINDILDVAKIEAGRFEIHPQPLDMREAAESSLALVQERAHAGGIELISRFGADVPPILGDPVRVKQILLNILSNAVKFTPEGGRVTLAIRPGPAGFVTAEVTDTGIGMSGEDIAVAMQPFGQVDSHIVRRAGGTGLGLPLVRSFVDMHGGEMEIESRRHEGTTVRIRLPTAPPAGEGA